MLFANERESNLESTLSMVEDVLIEMGHFLNDCRRERSGSACAWTISKGSATIDIDLVEHPEGYRVRASAVVMTLDENTRLQPLFKQVLVLNAVEVTGAAFALQSDKLLLLSERSTIDLDRSELRGLVDRVRRFADEYDDKLVQQFGGTIGAAKRER